MRAFLNEQALRARVEKHRSRKAVEEAIKVVEAKMDVSGALTESERRELHMIPESDGS